MTNGLIRTLAVLINLGLALRPSVSHAYELDSQFDCKSNAHSFISSLINDEYIDSTPMRVEKNSVNAFRPMHGSKLTVFGFRVYAVVGFEHDDAMFKPGSGTAIPTSLYGVVVTASSDKVAERVRLAGSDADVREITPFLMTAIICTEH